MVMLIYEWLFEENNHSNMSGCLDKFWFENITDVCYDKAAFLNIKFTAQHIHKEHLLE